MVIPHARYQVPDSIAQKFIFQFIIPLPVIHSVPKMNGGIIISHTPTLVLNSRDQNCSVQVSHTFSKLLCFAVSKSIHIDQACHLKMSRLFVCFVALRLKSTAMVMAGRSVHLTTLYSWASLNKHLTSTSCTYFGL